MHLQRYDQEFLVAFNNRANYEKKKKKLSMFQRNFFYNYLYQRGLQFYFRAMSRFSYLLLELGLIQQRNDAETYQYRFENRYNIFAKIYYLKQITFQEFEKDMKEFCNDVKDQSKVTRDAPLRDIGSFSLRF